MVCVPEESGLKYPPSVNFYEHPTNKKNVPNKNMYVEVETEMIEHQQVLDQTKLTQEQLIDVGISICTDFNLVVRATVGKLL
jgi:hypothetical protein